MSDAIHGVPNTKRHPSDSEAAEKRHIDVAPQYDNPFGDEEYAEVKYRTLHWW